MRALPLSAALLSLALIGCTISRAEEVSVVMESGSSSSHSIHTITPLPAITASSSSIPAPFILPPAVQLDVPFTSQAPFKNWDEPYQNACEEASLLTLVHYLENRPFTQELADQEIVAFTTLTANIGYGISITLEELADISRKVYPQYKAALSTDVTIDSIKRSLARGKPVIVPTAGRILQNPYYTGAGPWYHMLVITGYDETNFTTNDVGTGHGERYAYPHALLLDAIHDWVGQDERIAEGRKIMMTLDVR